SVVPRGGLPGSHGRASLADPGAGSSEWPWPMSLPISRRSLIRPPVADQAVGPPIRPSVRRSGRRQRAPGGAGRRKHRAGRGVERRPGEALASVLAGALGDDDAVVAWLRQGLDAHGYLAEHVGAG